MLTRDLARWALAQHAAGLPPAVAAQARLHVADSVGIGLAAAREPVATQVSAAMHVVAGDAAVLGDAHRRPATMAAFENAARMHVLDFDDVHDGARLHPTTVTLAAALAVADARTSLAALTAAVGIGNEVACRLGVACAPDGSGPGSDWFLTQLFGYFSAAVASALVLGLDEDDVVSALGLAYMQAAGGKEAGFGVGATARAIYPAFAAQGGVQAVLLAQAGVTGPASALEGRAGLFRTYLGLDPERAAPVLLDVRRWEWTATAIRPWPCCRFAHGYVDAALRVHRALDGAPAERVVAAVNRTAASLCTPLPARRRPATLQDAKYSIPFMIAFALAHGRVDLDNLHDGALRDPAVLALAERVEIAQTLPDGGGLPPAQITVQGGGQAHHAASGGPLSLAEADCARKFARCVRAVTGDAAALWGALREGDGAVRDVLRAAER